MAASPYEAAQLLVASWALANADKIDKNLPTSGNILDKALQAAIEEGAYDSLKESLHFVESRVGLQCVELPAILSWAQAAELTQDPNPSYRETQIKISERAAKRIARRLGHPEDRVREWGHLLAQKAHELRETPDFV